MFEGVKRLKPDKVRYFDSLDKTFIATYYKRLNFLAYAYKEPLVLATLLLYMQRDASNQFIRLDNKVTKLIKEDLDK